jgi:hypothetical protein
MPDMVMPPPSPPPPLVARLLLSPPSAAPTFLAFSLGRNHSADLVESYL